MGICKTRQEIAFPVGNPWFLTGNLKTLQEFIKPDRNLQFPSRNREQTLFVVDLQPKYGHSFKNLS
jgi:hypothetical protein